MPGERSLLIDPIRCVGCNSCLAACAVWNSLPLTGGAERKGNTLSPQRWISVQHNYSENARTIMMCLHCSEPLCMEACPEDAIYIQNGWVVINRDKCIGCGSCVSACPYRAVHRENFKEAKAAKCDGCMSSYSEVPRCASVCPTGAIEYGYRTALIKEGSARAAEYGMQLFGREQHGAQNVLRIGTRETYSRKRSPLPLQLEIGAAKSFHRFFAMFPMASLFPRRVYALARTLARFFMK